MDNNFSMIKMIIFDLKLILHLNRFNTFKLTTYIELEPFFLLKFLYKKNDNILSDDEIQIPTHIGPFT